MIEDRYVIKVNTTKGTRYTFYFTGFSYNPEDISKKYKYYLGTTYLEVIDNFDKKHIKEVGIATHPLLEVPMYLILLHMNIHYCLSYVKKSDAEKVARYLYRNRKRLKVFGNIGKIKSVKVIKTTRDVKKVI